MSQIIFIRLPLLHELVFGRFLLESNHRLLARLKLLSVQVRTPNAYQSNLDVRSEPLS